MPSFQGNLKAQNPKTPIGHLLVGSCGEDVAEQFLEGKGYQILERNARTSGGEIDLVAEDQGVIIFVEVKAKTRADGLAPSIRVNHEKLERLYGAAQAWFDKRGKEGAARIDVIGVCNGEVVEHYEDVTW